MMETGRDKESAIARLSGERETISQNTKALCALQWDVSAPCSSHSEQTARWQRAPLSMGDSDAASLTEVPLTQTESGPVEGILRTT